MYCQLVDTARPWDRGADGHVTRALDLLIKQGIARKAGDVRVGADRELTQATSAFIGVKGLE